MAEERVAMLDMEERLFKDADGQYRKEVLDELQAHRATIKRAMDAGVAPDEFAALSKLMTAVDAAGAVFENVWRETHH